MVVGSEGGNMVGRFFREDLSEVGILRWERDFGFRLFGGDSEFCCCSELGNEQGVQEEALAVSVEDPVDLAVVQGVLEVLVLCVVVEVVVEMGIIDGVYVDMSVGAGEGFSEERVVLLGISGMS